MDISSLLERPTAASSPGNASNSSKTSTSSRTRDDTAGPAHFATSTSATTAAPHPVPHFEYHQASHTYPPMQTMHHSLQKHPPGPSHYHTMTPYAPYPPPSMPDPRVGLSIPISQVAGPTNKRLAPPQPHPAEPPAKKKQSKWTADEDRSIIELRGNGMKWEDISKHLPGRSAISCRLRFQNYLERRSEWDEEKKNKLARLYERCVRTYAYLCVQLMLISILRFKKDMWEKISKEMQLPWRAAEAMHWQIGEVEMAQRANVPVFHLAGQQGSATGQAGPGSEGRASTSPSSGNGAALPGGMGYSHTHNHSLPHIPQPLSYPVSPVQARFRRNSDDTSPHGSLRHRADSARSVPSSAAAMSRAPLPPLNSVSGAPTAMTPLRYTLPPVSTTSESLRR